MGSRGPRWVPRDGIPGEAAASCPGERLSSPTSAVGSGALLANRCAGGTGAGPSVAAGPGPCLSTLLPRCHRRRLSLALGFGFRRGGVACC